MVGSKTHHHLNHVHKLTLKVLVDSHFNYYLCVVAGGFLPRCGWYGCLSYSLSMWRYPYHSVALEIQVRTDDGGELWHTGNVPFAIFPRVNHFCILVVRFGETTTFWSVGV